MSGLLCIIAAFFHYKMELWGMGYGLIILIYFQDVWLFAIKNRQWEVGRVE